jgi:phosphoribosylformylglycinamidine (FGAM) synthase-like enzyme
VSCVDTIEIPPGRYAAIVQERYHFVVTPGQEEPQIERVVKTEREFLVVEKIGEAREQIDRDHPQRHHRDWPVDILGADWQSLLVYREVGTMSKDKNAKKSMEKKAPQKTLKEKRQAKKAKK